MSNPARLVSSPSQRTTTLVRLSSDSSTVGSNPTSASLAATYSAAARSPGPLESP